MKPFTAATLVRTFGNRSALAQHSIPKLYQALTPAHHAGWHVPDGFKLKPLTKLYRVTSPSPELFFVVQTYYALVVKLLAAYALAPPQSIAAVESGDHFRQHHLLNVTCDDMYSWYLHTDFAPGLIEAAAANLSYDNPPPDALKTLYQNLVPRKLRHALGEYYTPDWLARHTLARLNYDGEQRLLDPACGSGTFLALALHRMDTPDLTRIAGIDVNWLACLAARANLILATGAPDTPTTLPVYHADSILNPPDVTEFDCIAGNPPWVNWETLPDSYRNQTRHLWQTCGLFPHTGMDAILGKGKKDLALLLTYVAAERYLADGGKMALILPENTLKTGGAGMGFRRFRLADDTPLRVLHVDDMSQIRPFYGVHARSVVMVMQKGQATDYPVNYTLWRRTPGEDNLLPDDTPELIQRKTRRSEFVAAPIDAPQSAWMSGKPAALQAARKLVGQSDYTAHAGIYSGGANAVYWLKVLEWQGETVRVQNIVKGAKRKVKQVKAVIESELVFPFLRGRDVSRWQATPKIHILVVQDPKTRRGYDEDWFKETYPLAYAYLEQFKPMLLKRAAYRRYFDESDPFYTMFDVGTYTFTPVKTVWQGFGSEMQAAVITQQGAKAVMCNQAMHPFIGLQHEDEAHYLAALLNSAPFEYAVISHTQQGGKSFAQSGILETLRLPAFNPEQRVHRELARLSWEAHAGNPQPVAIAEAAAEVWKLTPQELDDVIQSLHELR